MSFSQLSEGSVNQDDLRKKIKAIQKMYNIEVKNLKPMIFEQAAKFVEQQGKSLSK